MQWMLKWMLKCLYLACLSISQHVNPGVSCCSGDALEHQHQQAWGPWKDKAQEIKHPTVNGGLWSFTSFTVEILPLRVPSIAWSRMSLSSWAVMTQMLVVQTMLEIKTKNFKLLNIEYLEYLEYLEYWKQISVERIEPFLAVSVGGHPRVSPLLTSSVKPEITTAQFLSVTTEVL